MMNKLFLEGRFTMDPYVNDKGSVCFFILAQSTGFKDKNGDPVTNFVKLKAFGNLVKVIGDYCLKGDLISVEAHVTTEKNKDEYTTAVIVDNMHFLAKAQPKEEEKKSYSRRR